MIAALFVTLHYGVNSTAIMLQADEIKGPARGALSDHPGTRHAEDLPRASAARFEAEQEFSKQPDVEVAVCGLLGVCPAHARYFERIKELAEDTLGSVGPHT